MEEGEGILAVARLATQVGSEAMRDYNGKQDRIIGRCRCRCCHRDFDLVRGLFICPFSGEKLILISFQSTDYIKGHTKGYQKNPERSHGWIRLLMDSDLLGG